MSSRCTALLAEIDQRLGCWLGMEEDGEISGDDVVEENDEGCVGSGFFWKR